MPTAAFKGRPQLRASSVCVQNEYIRAQQAHTQMALMRIRRRKPHADRQYSFDHRTPDEQIHLWTKRKKREMTEDRLRIRDEENMRTFHNIQHDPPKFLTGGTCRTDMPTSTGGNGIDMPGPTPKEYREHKVNKVKELDSEKWAQVNMCKRMVKDSKPWKGLARKELAKHAAKYEYTKRSMALTAPSARLSIMSLPSGESKRLEHSRKSKHALLEKAMGRTTRASRVAELGRFPFDRGLRTQGRPRSARHIDECPLSPPPGSPPGPVMTICHTDTGLDASVAPASLCRVPKPVALPVAAHNMTTAIDWTPVDPVPPYDRGRAKFADASPAELSTASFISMRTENAEAAPVGWAYPTAPTVAGSYRRLDLKPAPDRSVGGLHRTLKRDVRRDPIISVTVTHPTKGDTLVTKAVPRPVYAYPTISGNVDF